MKISTISLALISAAILSSCATTEPKGGIYTAVTLPEAASSARGNKTGTSEAKSYLGLVAVGDASIETAKRNGGITVVSSVDRKVENVLGIIGTYTTVVTGR